MKWKKMGQSKILISQCLYGEKIVRYDGIYTESDDVRIQDLKKRGLLIPVCPEVFGGLSVPHAPSEINSGSVISKTGEDLTDVFVLGATRALNIARKNNCRVAILKSKSPSCGVGEIYDGSFEGRLIPGFGILASILHEAGLSVYNENQVDEAIAFWMKDEG